MAIQIIITGRVQGIFFRAFVEDTAKELGIRGFVRNLPDGGLEVFAEGTDKALDELVERCKKGPSGATIDDIKVTRTRERGYERFDIVY